MAIEPVASYSIPQRAIHWIMAALVFFNLLFTEGMEELSEAAEEGQTPSADMIASANIHAYVGIAVLAFVIVRLGLRLTSGAPAASAEEPPVLQLLSKIVHATFYLLFFALPLTGIATYYFGFETLGSLHGGPLKLLMWVLIIVHVGAVLIHQFYWKTDVMRRMTRG